MQYKYIKCENMVALICYKAIQAVEILYVSLFVLRNHIFICYKMTTNDTLPEYLMVQNYHTHGTTSHFLWYEITINMVQDHISYGTKLP